MHVGESPPYVDVFFTPTIPHCSMATLIGLCLSVKLLRSLPSKFKLRVAIAPGAHASEDEINKQLADKERVAAALENPHLLKVVNKCVSQSSKVPEPIWAHDELIQGGCPCCCRSTPTARCTRTRTRTNRLECGGGGEEVGWDGCSGLDPQPPAVPGVRGDSSFERRGLAERVPGAFTSLLRHCGNQPV